MRGTAGRSAAITFAVLWTTIVYGSETAVGTMLSTQRYGRQSTLYLNRSVGHSDRDSAGIGIDLPHDFTLCGSYHLYDTLRRTGPLQLFLTTPRNRGDITAGIGFGEEHEEQYAARPIVRCIGPDIKPYTCIDTVNDFVTTITSVRKRSLHGGAAVSYHRSAGRTLFAGIDGSVSALSGVRFEESTERSSLAIANYARNAWNARSAVTAGILDSFEFLGIRWAATVRLLWNNAQTSSVALPDEALTARATSQQSGVTLMQYTGDRITFNSIHLSYQWEEYDPYQLLRERMNRPVFSLPFFTPDTFVISARYETGDSRQTIVNRWALNDGSYQYGITHRHAIVRSAEALAGFGMTLHLLRYGYLQGSCTNMFGTDFCSTGFITVADINAGLRVMIGQRLFIDMNCTPLRITFESETAPHVPPYRFFVSIRGIVTGL